MRSSVRRCLRDGSSRPLTSPNATQKEVVGKIVYLRENYHFGPHKISMYLQRYHDITISPSGVWNILKQARHQPIVQLAALQAPQGPLEALRETAPRPPSPDRRQVHRAPSWLSKKYYQYTAIDDCTRIRVLRIYAQHNQKSAIQFLDYVLEKLPFQVETSRRTMGPNFRVRSTGTCSIEASATSTSDRPRLG